MSYTTKDLEGINQFAIEVAKEAGSILERYSLDRRSGGANDDIELKLNPVDIVTKADEEIEKYIIQRISKKYPSHQFVGEESYSKGESKNKYIIGNGPTWCIDPLDGTVNFVHSFPMVCISIAFLINGRPVVGVINAPFINQLYSSFKGGGSWLNETIRLPLSQGALSADAPKGLLFSCEWGKSRNYKGDLKKKLDSFIRMAQSDDNGGYVHGVRSIGSAALDMAFIASGSSDIFWELGCWEWDIAAGVILVEESGGIVTNGNPPKSEDVLEVHLGSRQYLAIRSCTGTEDETAREAQERVARSVWSRVETIEYDREGV